MRIGAACFFSFGVFLFCFYLHGSGSGLICIALKWVIQSITSRLICFGKALPCVDPRGCGIVLLWETFPSVDADPLTFQELQNNLHLHLFIHKKPLYLSVLFLLSQEVDFSAGVASNIASFQLYFCVHVWNEDFDTVPNIRVSRRRPLG